MLKKVKKYLLTALAAAIVLPLFLALFLLLPGKPAVTAEAASYKDASQLSDLFTHVQNATAGVETVIKLTQDITMGADELAIEEGRIITLDFNGHTLTASTDTDMLGAYDGSTLNIVDNSAGKKGKIDCKALCRPLYVGSGTINFYDIEVVNSNYDHSVYVAPVTYNTTFNMHSGSITGHNAEGIIYNLGTFNMYDGKIYGNEVGSGVYVGNNATFKMFDGVISGNYADSNRNGGGVYVGGTFEMSGGTITDNRADFGGGVYLNGGTLKISDNADIYKNRVYGNYSDESFGGGVYVDNSGKLEMTGGEIDYNEADYGGGVYVKSGTFNMSGSTSIYSNAANNYGGGVYSLGSFTMSGGDIYDNTADNGMGVYVDNSIFNMNAGYIDGNRDGAGAVYIFNGTFNMSSGEIYDNIASDYNGGGVYLASGAFNLSGGSIYSNKADYGGGVYVKDGMFSVWGNPKVYDARGMEEGAETNVYLVNGKTITCKTLTAGANIGITLENGTGAFTSGYKANNSTQKPSNYFFSDDDYAYCIVLSGNEATVTSHSFGGWTTVTEPTCSSTGLHQRMCTVCGYTEEGILPKNPNNHSLVHHNAQAPTCTSIGWDAYDTCSLCSYTTYKEKAALGHSYSIKWGNWTSDNKITAELICNNDSTHTAAVTVTVDSAVTTKSTCTAKGTRTYTATATSTLEFTGNKTATKQVDEPMIPHDFKNSTIWCHDGGYHWKRCANCTAEDVPNKVAHSGGTATCTAQAVCTVCNTAYGNALGHSYDGIVISTPPTTTEYTSFDTLEDIAGMKVHSHCSRCGNVEEVPFEKAYQSGSYLSVAHTKITVNATVDGKNFTAEQAVTVKPAKATVIWEFTKDGTNWDPIVVGSGFTYDGSGKKPNVRARFAAAAGDSSSAVSEGYYYVRGTSESLLVNGSATDAILNAGNYTLTVDGDAFGEYELTQNEATIKISPVEIEVAADESNFYWTLTKFNSALRDGYIDSEYKYYSEAGEGRTFVKRSIVRNRNSSVTVRIHGERSVDNLGDKGLYTIEYGEGCTAQELGQYTAHATIKLKDTVNYKFVMNGAFHPDRHMTAVINADGSVALEKVWYIAQIDNGLLSQADGSYGEAWNFVGWTFGNYQTQYAPRLEHGDEGERNGNYVFTADDDKVIFKLYKTVLGAGGTHEDVLIGEKFNRYAFADYINASVPAGSYKLLVTVQSYTSTGAHEHWWNGDTHGEEAKDIVFDGFTREFVFNVDKAELTFKNETGLKGQTFDTYTYDGNLHLYGNFTPDVPVLYASADEREGIWKQYNDYYGGAEIQFSLQRWGTSGYLNTEALGDIKEAKQSPREADTYILKYKFVAPNYEEYGGENSFTVVIAKAQVELPASQTVSYDGKEHSFTVAEDALYTSLGGRFTDVNADGYDVTLKLKDSDNYIWKNGDEDETVVKLIIEKPAQVDPEEPGHEHLWYGGWQCNGENHYRECATCGARKEVTAHDFDWVVDTAPTIGNAGVKHEECSVCGYKRNEGTEIPALEEGGHVHSMQHHSAAPATCTEGGTKEYWHCDGCNKDFADENGYLEINPADLKTVATGHSWSGEWESNGASHWHVCLDCGARKDSSAHSFDWVVDTAPTTESAGVKHEECSVCGQVRSAGTEIPELDAGHTHNMTPHSAEQTTCTREGKKAYWHCDGCNKDFADENGYLEITAEELVVPAKGHVWGEVWHKNDQTHYHVCTACGEHAEGTAHGYDWVVDTAPTTESAGVKHEECSVCGHIRNAGTEIPAIDGGHTHTLTAHSAEKATCTENGRKAYWHCDGCNKYFADKDGYLEISVSELVIPAKGHIWSDGWSRDENGHFHVCTVCATHIDGDEHNLTWVADELPTTEHAGVKHEECTVCGYKRNEGTEIPKLADGAHVHKMQHHAAVGATCTEIGIKEYWHCTECGKDFADADGYIEVLLSEYIYPAKGHVLGDGWSKDENGHFHECTVCGAHVDVTAHDYNWVVDTAPTTESAGVKHEECSVCGHKRNEGMEIPKLDAEHRHELSYRQTEQATCTYTGLKEYWHCTECGKNFADADGYLEVSLDELVIPATGHTLRDGWVKDQSGHYRECSVCGTHINAAEHDYNWVVDSAPTTESAGVKHEECAVCGYKRNEGVEIPRLDPAHVHEMIHRDSVAVTCTHNGIKEYWHCATCNKDFADVNGYLQVDLAEHIVRAKGHVWSETHNCNSEYHYFECETCGERKEVSVHSFDWIIDTKPTTETVGRMHERCSVCGYERSEGTEIPKLEAGHTHNLTKHDAVQPTCTKGGTKAYWHCETCGKDFADENGYLPLSDEKILANSTIPAKGHVWGDTESNGEYHFHECSECGARKDVAAHDYNWVVDTAPTTETAGVKHEECEICGHRRNEGTEIPKLDAEHTHNMTAHKAEEATCTENGIKAYWHCEACNKDFADEDGYLEIDLEKHIIPATGHTWSETRRGNSEYHYFECEICGERKEVAKHDYSWVVDTVPTTESTGVKHEECSVCGHKRSEGEVIPKLDAGHTHNMTKHGAVQATCTKDGTKEYWHCDGCNKNFADENGYLELTGEELEIPAKGHVWNDGWSSDAEGHFIECIECGEHKEVAMHDYNWVVDTAPTTESAGVKHEECAVCGHKRSEGTEIPKLDAEPAHTHAMTYHEAVPSTCTENGVKAYWHCEECGKYFADKDGYVEIVLAEHVIPAKGHSWGESWSNDGSGHWHECAVCGYRDEATFAAHDYNWVIDKAPTSVTRGIKHEECSVCGHKRNIGLEIPVVDITHTHKMEKHRATVPTCSLDGTKQYWHCTECNKDFADASGYLEIREDERIRPATGHELSTEWDKDGIKHWHVCLICGEHIDEADHSFNWIVDTEATTENSGIKHEECSVCGQKRSENTLIDKLPGGTEITEPTDGNKDGVPWWVWLLIALCVVAVGAGVATVILLKKNAKKQATTVVMNGGNTDEIMQRLNMHDEQIEELMNRDDGGFNDIVEDGNGAEGGENGGGSSEDK